MVHSFCMFITYSSHTDWCNTSVHSQSEWTQRYCEYTNKEWSLHQPATQCREGVNLWYTHSVHVCLSVIPLTQNSATPLYIASCNGHSDTVNTLIRNGADINLTYKVLYTTIHSYQSAIVNTVHSSLQGWRPIDIARTKGHSDIVHILEKAGKQLVLQQTLYLLLTVYYHSIDIIELQLLICFPLEIYI